jgi:hypothetical protein
LRVLQIKRYTIKTTVTTMTEDSEKQHVEIKMNTRGQEKHNLIMNTREQDERNLAEVLRFKQFYY